MDNMPSENNSHQQDIKNFSLFWKISPYAAKSLLKACDWDVQQAQGIMELFRRVEFRDDSSWRLTPKEQLFAPPQRDVTMTFSPSVNASDHVMRMLADGRRIDQDLLMGFRHVLAEDVISQEPVPLAGYDDLIQALHADYAYYDADRHLDGFLEGMIYGMTQMAETIVELLDERGESFLPASVLLHPDILLAATTSHTMDVDKIAKKLCVSQETVINGLISLLQERIVITTVEGKRRFFFPSWQGERFAERLSGMIGATLDAAEGDVDEATEQVMGLADFDSCDAVRRAIMLMSE